MERTVETLRRREEDPPAAAPVQRPAPQVVTQLMELQRTVGNAAVANLVARCPDCNGACADAAAGHGPAIDASSAATAQPIEPAQAMEQIAGASSPDELQAIAQGLKKAAAARQEASAPTVATLARQPTGSTPPASSGGFCTPYGFTEVIEAAEAKAFLIGFLPAASTGMFQSAEVGSLWLAYLTDSAPATRTFRGAASTVVRGFETAQVMLTWHRNLFNEAVNRLKASPPYVPATGETRIPVSTLLSSTDVAIDFSNPFDIPGHIAGGVGSGDASVDSRDLSGDLIIRRQLDVSGTTTGFEVISDFHYHCHDTVDFCPGQAGSGLEQNLTIPLSRLEATGMAHDVPFDVFYEPAPLTATLAPGDLPEADPTDARNRDLPGRDPDRRETRDLRTPADLRGEESRASSR
jgi:hypothetical protein